MLLLVVCLGGGVPLRSTMRVFDWIGGWVCVCAQAWAWPWLGLGLWFGRGLGFGLVFGLGSGLVFELLSVLRRFSFLQNRLV